MMYRKPLVPEEFIVPLKVRMEKFVLKPLTIECVDLDFEAVQHSVDKEGNPTPRPDLTKQQNLIDLAWHQKEFQKRSSFAYTILSPGEKECWGCLYVYPADNNKEIEVVVDFWLTSNAYRKFGMQSVGKIIEQWLMEYWSFGIINLIPLQMILRCKASDGEIWERDNYSKIRRATLDRDSIYPDPVMVKRKAPFISTQK